MDKNNIFALYATRKQQKNNSQQEIHNKSIGYVFKVNNNSGFVVSNKLSWDIKKEPFPSFKFESKNVIGKVQITQGELVTFRPQRSIFSKIATDVMPLYKNEKAISILCRYVGTNTYIEINNQNFKKEGINVFEKGLLSLFDKIWPLTLVMDLFYEISTSDAITSSLIIKEIEKSKNLCTCFIKNIVHLINQDLNAENIKICKRLFAIIINQDLSIDTILNILYKFNNLERIKIYIDTYATLLNRALALDEEVTLHWLKENQNITNKLIVCHDLYNNPSLSLIYYFCSVKQELIPEYYDSLSSEQLTTLLDKSSRQIKLDCTQLFLLTDNFQSFFERLPVFFSSNLKTILWDNIEVIKTKEIFKCFFYKIKTIFSYKDYPLLPQTIRDDISLFLYVLFQDIDYLNYIEDLEKEIFELDSKYLAKFLLVSISAVSEPEDKETIALLFEEVPIEKLANAISDFSNDDKFKAFNFIGDEKSEEILYRYYQDQEIYHLWASEIWNKTITQIPYVSFDLEFKLEKEKSLDSLYQFAYRKEGVTRFFDNKGQFKELIRELEDTQIIVGHNIKRFDLPFLSTQGLNSPAFIWDTLEIELLLNPMRNSYALHTEHCADKDTDLEDNLFCNQLARIALNSQLKQEIKDFLPPNINKLIEFFSKPIFKGKVENLSKEDDFFEKTSESYPFLINSLEDVGENFDSQKVLLLAPKKLWNTISRVLDVSFIDDQDSIKYSHISLDKVLADKNLDKFSQAFLTRFVTSVKSAVVANLPTYFVANYLKNDKNLNNYVDKSTSNIECRDIEDFLFKKANYDTIVKSFDKVFFLGFDVENRACNYQHFCKLTIEDLYKNDCYCLFRAGASKFINIPLSERSNKLFANIPSEANIWLQRDLDNNYWVNYSYNYYKIINDYVKDHKNNCEVLQTAVINRGTEFLNINFVKNKDEDIEDRLLPTTVYRSEYWAFQLQLLQYIYLKEYKPIIYIIDEDDDVIAVSRFAKAMGFYIPEKGSLVRRLEILETTSRGLLVIYQKDFDSLISWRADAAFCYVWDHLAVDKRKMIWNSDNGADLLLDGLDDDLKKLGQNDKNVFVLCALWPLFQCYSKLIKDKNINSTAYIIDPYLEDYAHLYEDFHCSIFKYTNFTDSVAYNTALEQSKKYFKDARLPDIPIKEDSKNIKLAMNIIINTLVKTPKNPHPVWSDIQKQILPKILKKQDNYLISMPTGGGKSVLFQGPTLYNAVFSSKLSIVVSPLKALMQDQVEELWEKGFVVNVDYLNSDKSYAEVEVLYKKIRGGELSLLYVAPERFRSRKFEQVLLERMKKDNGLEYFIFDEAHCVIQWGMDFRPDYLNVLDKCSYYQKQGYKFSIQMFTATVTEMTYNKINGIIPVTLLGKENDKKIYSPIRNHITLKTITTDYSRDERVELLSSIINDEGLDPENSRCIIFFNSRKLTEATSEKISDELHKSNNRYFEDPSYEERVDFYHAGLDSSIRNDVYDRYNDSKDPLYILCATKAFGMGMDIPNIHSVIHYTVPSSLEDYLQEVGRAGRNKNMYIKAGFSEESPINATCLYNYEDVNRNRDLLLSKSLSWFNLESIREFVETYIKKYISLEQAISSPVFITLSCPPDLNLGQNANNKFRSALFWLTKLNRINLGYYSSPFISLTYYQQALQNKKKISDVKTNKLIKIIEALSLQENNGRFQVSLATLSKKLLKDTNYILERLFWLHKENFITLHQETTFKFFDTRVWEIRYLLEAYQQERNLTCSIELVINATFKILKSCSLFKEKVFSLQNLKESFDFTALKNKVKDGRLPWAPENDKKKISLFSRYEDQFTNKFGIGSLLLLLDFVPGAKITWINKAKDEQLITIYLKNKDWKNYLTELRKTSLEIINFAKDNEEVAVNVAFVYNTLKLKSFKLFKECLAFLRKLNYLRSSPFFLQTIELYATTETQKPILENDTDHNSLDVKVKAEFDNTFMLQQLRISVVDILVGKLAGQKQKQAELINDYFAAASTDDLVRLLEKYYDEDDEFWNMIQENSIKAAESKIQSNPEQWNIYINDVNEDVNVEAGPGSGKTHILALKCANLVYRHHINPRNILVLAYNRAVVVELKLRLGRLFSSLGLSRAANKLNIYTFHGLAKYLCKDILNDVDLSMWEQVFLNYIRENSAAVREALPSIQYIYIDEFQDITQLRLNAICELKNNIYKSSILFTIGDKNQSIYGFEKLARHETMDPNYYYEQLYNNWKVKQKTMYTNYRSFPEILDKASIFLPKGAVTPHPCNFNIKVAEIICKKYFTKGAAVLYEARTETWNGLDNIKNSGWVRNWAKDVLGFVNFCVNTYNVHVDDLLGEHQITNHVRDVAVFFRTNNEVYQGYTKLKNEFKDNFDNIRIRVQGTNNYELFRVREIYYVLLLLDRKYGNNKIIIKNSETERHIKGLIQNIIDTKQNWDNFYLDFIFTLILDYLDTITIDETSYTYSDMVIDIKESLKEDSPQLYKIYDNYKDRRIFKDDHKINVVLTTMHKVKGLEFDAVFITPSYFKFIKDPELDEVNWKDQVEEERRLYYVAYTRAKKYLAVYRGQRENAVLEGVEYQAENLRRGVFEREEALSRYNLGWFNFARNFKNCEYINTNVKRNDRVMIKCEGENVYNIIDLDLQGTPVIGQLASRGPSTGDIVSYMKRFRHNCLYGFYVSDIIYWTYQDSLDVDARNALKPGARVTNYAQYWCNEARNQGFVPIVTIAGYGFVENILS